MNSNHNESSIIHFLRWIIAIFLIMVLLLLAPTLGLYRFVKSLFSFSLVVQSGHFTIWSGAKFAIDCGICIFCFVLEWRILRCLFTKYDFHVQGVDTYFMSKKPKVVLWSDFQEICICYADYNTRTNGTLTKVICLVRNGEKKNIYGRWKVDAFWRYPRIIRLNYTQELYDQISSTCPYRIVNYCD